PAVGADGRPAAAATPSSTGYGYGPEDPSAPAENLIAVFSSSTRKGRWRIGRRTNAFALFGNVEIDLTEALFGQRVTVINATSIFGNVEIRVPENISLRGGGTGVFGNFEVLTLEATDADAPAVVVNGYSVFGNVEAKPKRGKRVADLRDRFRKHLGH
uniref:LiaF domain-containing protein n=1 Tax=Streptomyces lushanensis TaxID=1434255 RepID=UPI000830DEAC